MAITVEVHGCEPWLTLEWEEKNLFPLAVREPSFDPSTDAHIFYEETLVRVDLYRKVPIEKRYGLLLEPSLGRPFAAQSLAHLHNYRMILTHDPSLLSLHRTYRMNLFGTSWVQEDDLCIVPSKNLIVSIVTSGLNRLPGHRLRLSLCKALYERKLDVDIFGRDIPWGPFIENKRDGIAPYLFSIAIENCQINNYFTEKLIDCFVTRTVPIYWGCPNIADFFDPTGLIVFEDTKDFWRKLMPIFEDPYGTYEKHKRGLEENFRRAAETYNARYAWGGVAKRITEEVHTPFVKPSLSMKDRAKFQLLSVEFLLKCGGVRPMVSKKIKTVFGATR